ncbi:MAG TPA: sulfatase-like hydrolase/transferase [Parafilimonas sp.]|nr:sulfatase-like hydrolase/transferase [Parafilimonas sp.]
MFSILQPLKGYCYILVAISTIFSAQTVHGQSKKPNIIFILGDDIGYEALGVNGAKSYSTPNLDAMAKQGMNFTECHSSPLCSPSRFLLLTGKDNFRNYTEWGVMDTSQRTIGNMLRYAGYKTACFGKWQLDGGAPSINRLGFDSYCVWHAFAADEDEEYGARYKNPKLYANGEKIDEHKTAGKYGEDIFTDSVINFIERNKTSPFFIYYPMVLGHEPCQPTPDDTVYASWSFPKRNDTSFFPSMVKYMDKKIGQIISKVNELGIQKNTIIIYCGDNGTAPDLKEYLNNDSLIWGGKGATNEMGTHVPMIVYWPGTVAAGKTNNDLIAFTDFLPTFADIAGIERPTNYGALDGVSFAPRLKNGAGTPREWIFYHYDHHPGINPFKRWAQTNTYKLYDTCSTSAVRKFYNIEKDINEKNPLSDASLTPAEKEIKEELLEVITEHIAEGAPIFRKSALSNVTDSSVVITDSIEINGGSTITSSGIVWNIFPNPTVSSCSHTSNGPAKGKLQATIKNLKANTTYYIRAYAVNYAGTTYSNQLSFKTPMHNPVATPATLIDTGKFTANWKPVSNASTYKLDVSTSSVFSVNKPVVFRKGFDHGLKDPQCWQYSYDLCEDYTSYASAAPSIDFEESKASIITRVLDGYATELSFWIKGIGTNAASYLLVEGFKDTGWITIKKYTNLPTTGTTEIINTSSNPVLPSHITQFRFTYTKSAGTLAFDDVAMTYLAATPSFVAGYNNVTVNGTSENVIGLQPGKTYYYRVRAVDASSDTSLNSNTITTLTKIKSQSLADAIIPASVFPNPANSNATIIFKADGKYQITMMNIVGKILLHKTGVSSSEINNVPIDIGNYAKGVYLIMVTDEKNNRQLIELDKE